MLSGAFNHFQARDSLCLNKQIHKGQSRLDTASTALLALGEHRDCSTAHWELHRNSHSHSSKHHMFCISSKGCHYTNNELTRIRWSLGNRSCNDPGYLSSFQSLSLNLLFPFLEECFLLPLHLSNLQRLKFFFFKSHFKASNFIPLEIFLVIFYS